MGHIFLQLAICLPGLLYGIQLFLAHAFHSTGYLKSIENCCICSQNVNIPCRKLQEEEKKKRLKEHLQNRTFLYILLNIYLHLTDHAIIQIA